MYLFDQEVQKFLKTLNSKKVEYLVVGGFAVNYHGYIRATGDLDLWWNPTGSNFKKVLEAIQEFGFDCSDVEHLQKYDQVKSLIRLPLNEHFDIELLSLIDGKFTFGEAFQSANETVIKDIPIKVIDYVHLIKNKLGAHRAKDLHDIAELEKIQQTVKGKRKS